MRKKGQEILAKEMREVVRLVFLVIVFVAISFVVNGYINKKNDTGLLENDLLVVRALYSQNCLLYENERVNVGVIDLNKTVNAEKCFTGDNFGLFASITDMEKKEIKNFVINPNIADLRYGCNIIKKNFNCDYEDIYIRYYDGNEIKPGYMKLTMVRFNE